MLTMLTENTSSVMGNGLVSTENRVDIQQGNTDEKNIPGNLLAAFNQLGANKDFVFYAGTDKARM